MSMSFSIPPRTFSVEQSQMQVLIRRLSSLHLPRNRASMISWTSGERTSMGTTPIPQEDLLPVYEVNFDSRLWSVIQESSRMELFGLSLPEIGRLLGLRVRSGYFFCCYCCWLISKVLYLIVLRYNLG
ncbi:unnamed protein product [Trichobilharzia regenti]|nr:unnamed protein product [Trichobilharzia regenti]